MSWRSVVSDAFTRKPGRHARRPPATESISIAFRVVVAAVARQVTAPGARARRVVAKDAARVRRDEPLVEVDEVRVVGGGPLRAADAVRVMAQRARRLHADDVELMPAERLVAEDAGPVVALVAERVRRRALGRAAVVHVVARRQQVLEARAVRPGRPRAGR